MNMDTGTSTVMSTHTNDIERGNRILPPFDDPLITDADTNDPNYNEMPSFITEYISQIKFWLRLVVYPIIIVVVNVTMFIFILSFDVPLYNDDFDVYRKKLRLTISCYSVIFFVDACIVFYAIVRLERAMQEYDTTTNIGTSHSNNQSTIESYTTVPFTQYAQASRKLDNLLGRGSQPRGGTALINILWLLLIVVATFGLAFAVAVVYMMSPMYGMLCKTTPTQNSAYDGTEAPSPINITIDHIPSDLQEWAQKTHDISFGDDDGRSVHLSNGMNYFPVYDVSDSKLKLASKISNDSHVQFHSNVESPCLLTNIPHDNNRKEFSDSFCCLYLNFYESTKTASSWGQDNKLWYKASLLCAQSTQNGNDFFPNVTLFTSVAPIEESDLNAVKDWRGLSYHDKRLSGASLQSYNDELWLQLSFSYSESDAHTYESTTLLEFYKITGVGSTQLEKELVTSETFLGDNFKDSQQPKRKEPIESKPSAFCDDGTGVVFTIVVIVCMVSASAFLNFRKRYTVGIVPVYCIVAIFIDSFMHVLIAVAIVCLVSASAYLTYRKRYDVAIVPVYYIASIFAIIIMGSVTGISITFTILLAAIITFICGLLSIISIPLDREQLILALYFTVGQQSFAILNNSYYQYYYSSEYGIIDKLVYVFAMAALIGLVMDHPVLYIYGWIFGMFYAVHGFVNLIAGDIYPGLSTIGVGVIVGCGTVNLGSNLIKYRSKIIYSFKRLCFIVNNTIQQRMTAHQRTTTEAQQQRYHARGSVPTGGSNSNNTAGSVDVDDDMTSRLLNNTHTQ